MLAQETYSTSQVFTFCGHIANDDILNLKSGYVVANTPHVAISCMQEYGFSITAISSLAEVKEMIGILELIAERNSTIDPTEFVDLSDGKAPVADDAVFTFVGYYGNDQRVLKVGFALAPDSMHLKQYLHQHQFIVHSITSLCDLRDTDHELESIAIGSKCIDDCSYINLIETA